MKKSRVESKQGSVDWILANVQNDESWCIYFSSKLVTIGFPSESAATTQVMWIAEVLGTACIPAST